LGADQRRALDKVMQGRCIFLTGSCTAARLHARLRTVSAAATLCILLILLRLACCGQHCTRDAQSPRQIRIASCDCLLEQQ
jgi:hypothetical protein